MAVSRESASRHLCDGAASEVMHRRRWGYHPDLKHRRHLYHVTRVEITSSRHLTLSMRINLSIAALVMVTVDILVAAYLDSSFSHKSRERHTKNHTSRHFCSRQ